MRLLQATLKKWGALYGPPAGRTGELFLRNLQHIQARTDRLFYYLLVVQYPATVAASILWNRLSWSGGDSGIHFHVWLAITLGALLTSLPLYLIRTHPAAPMTRQVVAVAQMLTGALLIHVSGGRIETHFHIFGSLAFLAFYRDVWVLATATVVVSADHFFRGLLIPESVYGVVAASNWRFLEHAFWVVFENIFLTIACFQSRAQITEVASQQAQLEKVNETIEAAVKARTRELSLKTEELAAARDAAMESTRLKSQFLATVSHEIRTPMNGVLGMTGLLLKTDLSHDQRELAATAQGSAEALLKIINDILDLSKAEAGRLTLEQEDFLPCMEMDSVMHLLAEVARRKDLELVCEIDSSLPSVLSGDAGRLRQILVNLIGNAIKFTEEGGVIVRARQALRSGNVCLARFEVSDTGIGIAEEGKKRLFEAFVQVDGSTSRSHDGAGLGLAISKQLVEMMGGDIGFDSSPGVGSTFWFQIPLEAPPESRLAGLVNAGALSGLRVLIVDRDVAHPPLLIRALESFGATAVHVSDEGQAFALLSRGFEHQPFDVALLGVYSLGVDMSSLARALCERPELRETHLVMLAPSERKAACNSLRDVITVSGMVRPVRPEYLLLLISRLRVRSTGQQPALDHERLLGAVWKAQGGLSVLIAEDNVVNQNVLTRMLDNLGHHYTVVADGQAAVEAVKNSAFDVVLMDCHMPGVDGFTATAEIRQLPGPAGRIPIIAVTANAMAGDRERCLAAGMSGYVSKPIRSNELAEALQTTQPQLAPVA